MSTCKTPWVDIDSIPGGAKWGPFFWIQGWPCFEGLTFKHRGHLGSKYVYICLRLPTWNVNHGTKKEHIRTSCVSSKRLWAAICAHLMDNSSGKPLEHDEYSKITMFKLSQINT